MSTLLRDFEARLEEHFSALAEEKRRENFPVFALEHCLEPQQVQRLGLELGRALRSLHGLSPHHQLCWLVHAAEVGYDFDGQEYWYRFRQATPPWDYAYREELLRFFEVFSKRFGGVRPTGQWAKRFRYIAWPVAHALLPYDLQVQLARSIYNARHRLPEIAELDPSSTGEFIRRHTYDPTSRYRFFLQEKELVGWIVHALMQAGSDRASILHRPTLDRVLTNLNAAAHTREWLKDAQKQYARSTFHVPWSVRQAGTPQTAPGAGNASHDAVAPMKELLTPILSLRYEGEGKARAYVELPSFQQLINLHAEFRSHFEIANVQIPCHGDALMPAVMLLSGSGRQRPLRRWPGPEEVLADFRPKSEHFDQLVGAECRLTKTDLWLFKRVGDANAVQVGGLALRAGERYVVAARDKARFRSLIGDPVDLQCAGVHALEFTVPDVVPKALETLYLGAGLSMHRTVRVEPVGIFPRAWGLDSLGEWLTTETPCFVLERDHDFDSYQFSVNHGPIQSIDCGSSETLIVQLAGLGAGTHVIDLATRLSAAGSGPHIRPCASSTFSLHVRTPSNWVPGVLCSPALVVRVHPLAPTLTDFLSGEIELTVEGDPSRQVSCAVELLDESGQPLTTMSIGNQSLPLRPEHWYELVGVLLNRATDEHEFLSAAGAQLVIDADDLGTKRIPLLHTPSPVRWALSRSREAATLRLVDDGADEEVELTHIEFSQPLIRSALGREAAHEIDISSLSGLFLAQAGPYSEAVVVSPREVGRGLEWLGVPFAHTAFQQRDLFEVLDLNDLWRGARPCTPLSRFRQRGVTHRLSRYALELVTGRQWIQREELLNGRSDDPYWDQLESIVSTHRTYGVSLCYNWRTATSQDDTTLQLLARSVAKSFREFVSDEVSAIAWQFSHDDTQLNQSQRETLRTVDETNFSMLVRAARLLRLYRQHRRYLPEVQ
jgi:hypothetical protein